MGKIACSLLVLSTLLHTLCDAGKPPLEGSLSEIIRLPLKTVAAAGSHSCGLYEDGLMQCWGANNQQQLGYADFLSRGGNSEQVGNKIPVVHSRRNDITHFTAGNGRTITVFSNKVVGIFGRGSLYTDEDGEPGAKVAQADIDFTQGIAHVASGYNHDCFLLRLGSVKCLSAVRDQNYSRLVTGYDLYFQRYPPRGDVVPSIQFPGNLTATAVSVGDGFSCAILTDGHVHCWGSNSNGQLGQNASILAEGSQAPVRAALSGESSAVLIATGSAHACAVFESGKLKCWGRNNFGQLGLGDRKARGKHPGQMGDALPYVDLGQRVKDLVAGRHHTCAILEDRSVKCWGDNTFGQLGQAHVRAVGVRPGQVSRLEAVNLGADGFEPRQLALGDGHTCVLFTNGQMKCFGANDKGQLGIGDNEDRGRDALSMGNHLPFFPTSEVRQALQVSASAGFSCILLVTHRVVCMGGNSFGEPAAQNNRIKLARTSGPASQISTGKRHSCALIMSGVVDCWGENMSGQLGLGNVAVSPAPVTVDHPNLRGKQVLQVVSGDFHNCALIDAGRAGLEVRCWGDAAFGQLGYGAGFTSPPPKPPMDIENEDNSPDESEYEEYERASPPPVLNITSPQFELVRIGNFTPQKLVASVNSTCAISSSGGLVCWGAGYGIGVKALDLGQRVVDVGITDRLSCAIVQGGGLKCWPPLSSRDNTLIIFSLAVPEGKSVQISGGQGIMCLLLDTGAVSCHVPKPAGLVPASPFSEAKNLQASSVSASFQEACVLNADGLASCTRISVLGSKNPAYMRLDVANICFPGYQPQGKICAACAAGLFGALGEGCSSCPIGTFSTAGSVLCTPCPVGTYAGREKTGGACLPCEPGTYQDVTNSFRCVQCPGRTASLLPGASRRGDCVPTSGAFEYLGKVVDCPSQANCTRPGMALGNLDLRAGFWRLRNTSLAFEACPVPGTCVGGDGGEFNAHVQQQTKYCRDGHRGPYCTLCENGYVRDSKGLCRFCTEEMKNASFNKLKTGLGLIHGVFFFVGVVLAAFSQSQVLRGWTQKLQTPLSTSQGGSMRSLANIAKKESLRSLFAHASKQCKLVFATFQVLSAYLFVFGRRIFNRSSIAGLLFLDPNFFSGFLGTFQECFELDHNMMLVLVTLLPFSCLFAARVPLFLVCVLPEARGNAARFALAVTVLLFALVTPGVLTIIVRTFPCDFFDDDARSVLLRTDPSIACTDAQQTFATAMCIVYTLGVSRLFYSVLQHAYPSHRLYSVIFLSLRGKSVDHETEADNVYGWAGTILRAAYSNKYRWFEIAEFLRKVIQASFVVFYFDGTIGQVIVSLLLCCAALVWLCVLRPFGDARLTCVAVLGQLQLIMVCCIAIAVENVGEETQELRHLLLFVTWITPAVALGFSLSSLVWHHKSEASKIKNIKERIEAIQSQDSLVDEQVFPVEEDGEGEEHYHSVVAV